MMSMLLYAMALPSAGGAALYVFSSPRDRWSGVMAELSLLLLALPSFWLFVIACWPMNAQTQAEWLMTVITFSLLTTVLSTNSV
jgi:hypothetical protein